MSLDLKQLREDFAYLDDWEDRYRFVIEIGRDMDGLPDAEKRAENLVTGCASQVWIAGGPDDEGRMQLRGDSDALIVRGLVALALADANGRDRSEIAARDGLALFSELGLDDQLTAQRANGLRALLARIKQLAQA